MPASNCPIRVTVVGVTIALATTLSGGRATAAEQVELTGATITRWIQGDDLGFYYEIPLESEIWTEVDGPGTLLLYLLNHRSKSKVSETTVAVSIDGNAHKRFKMQCQRSKQRFTEGSLIPCRRTNRDVRIEKGKHRIGLQLTRTRRGASVRLFFVSKAESDAEPELATSLYGNTGSRTNATTGPLETTSAADVDRGLTGRAGATAVAPPGRVQKDPVAAGALAKPVYKRWWFWGLIGGVIAAGATVMLLRTGDRTQTVLPSGDLGTVDYRP